MSIPEIYLLSNNSNIKSFLLDFFALLTQDVGVLGAFEGALGNLINATASLGNVTGGLSSQLMALASTHPVITAIIGIATALGVATVAIDHFHVSAQESAEALSDMKSEYDSNKSELESLNSELETTQSRMDELLAKGHLTLTEQTELANLQAQNAELERTIALKEAQQKIDAKKLASQAEETYGKHTSKKDFWGNEIADQTYSKSEIEYYKKNYNTFSSSERLDAIKRNALASWWEGNVNEGISLTSLDFKENSDNINYLIGSYEALQEAQKNVGTELDAIAAKSKYTTGDELEDLTKQGDALQEYYDSLEKKSLEAQTYMDDYADVISNTYAAYKEAESLGVITDSQKEQLAEMESFMTEYMKTITNTASDVETRINNLFAKSQFITLKEKLVSAGKLGEDALKGVIDKTPGLTGALDEAGISAQQLSDHIMAIADPDSLRLDVIKKQLKEDFLADDYEINFKVGEASDKIWNDFIADKSDDEIEIFYKYIHDNDLDISDWNASDLKANFEKSIAETQQIIDSTKPVTFASLLAPDAEGNQNDFSKQIDTFQSDISSIQEVLDSLKDGEDVNLTDLVQEFGELSGQTGNLEEALTSLKEKKLGDVIADIFNAAKENGVSGTEMANTKEFIQNLINESDISDINLSNLKNTVSSALMSSAMDAIDRKMVQDTVKDLFNGIEITPVEPITTTFASLFKDEEGNDSDFSKNIDTFQEDVSSIQEALDSLKDGEEVDLTDLVQQFPELAGQTNNLEEALTSLKEKNLGNIISDIFSTAKENGLSESEMENTTEFIKNLINSADISDIDLGNVKNAVSSALMSSATDAIDRQMVQDIINNMFDGIKANISIEPQIKDTQSILSSISAVNSALSSQSTGASIDFDTFSSDELKDYQSALEHVNGTLQINEEKVRALNKAKAEEQIATNDANKAYMQSQYLENAQKIETLRQKILDNNYVTDENAESIQNQINSLLRSNSTIDSQCGQLDVLNASLRESVGLYQAWKDGQNQSESGDMFDDTLTALQKIEDVTKNKDSELFGRVGREDYKTSLDFIIPDTVDSNDTRAVNSYLDSIANLFTYDDGNRAGLNIQEFCQQAMDKGLMVLDEESDTYKIAGQKTMEDFAEGLNLSLPLVQAMFGEMEEFGGEFEWANFDTFGDGIVACTQEAAALQAELDQLNADRAAGIEVDDSRIQEASDKLDEVNAKKKELEEASLINIESNISVDSQIEQTKAAIEGWKLALESDPTNMTVQTNLADAEAELSRLEQEKEQLQEPTIVEITAAVNDINAQISEAQTQLDNLSNKEYLTQYNISDESASAKITELQGQIDTLNQKKAEIEAYAETDEAMSKLNELNNTNVDDKDFTIDVVDKATSVLNAINNTTLRDKSFTITTNKVTKTTESASVNGTAHVSGTTNSLSRIHKQGRACLNGDWGTKKSGRTLVGELGREIVVNSHTGRWYTVGDNGAEFVDIPKDSIVFNHIQTQSLLDQGYVSGRGMALASGTALSGGSDYVTGGIKVSNAKNSTVKYQPYSGSSTNKSYQKAVKKNTDETNKNTKAKTKSTQVFDWVAVRLKIFADKVQAIGDTITDFVSYTFANRQINKQIEAVRKEASANKLGHDAYLKKAKSVAQKYTYQDDNGKTRSISIPKKYQNKVRNGQWKIEDMDTSTAKNKALAEAIQKYQEYYENAKKCSETIRELKQEEKELYVQRMQNKADEYDAKIQRKNTAVSNIESGISLNNTSGKTNSAYSYKSMISASRGEENLLKRKKSALQTELESLMESGVLEAGSAEWYKWQEEIDGIDESINKCKVDQAEWNETIANMPVDRLKSENDRLAAKADKLQDNISLKDTTGKNVTSKDYTKLINNSQSQETNLVQQNNLLKEIQSKYETGSDKWKEYQEQIETNESAIRDAKQAQAEWNNEIAQIPIDKLQNANERLQVKAERIQDKIDVKEARGGSANSRDYNKLISNTASQNENLKEQNKLLEEQRDKCDKGSDRWKEFQSQIDANNSSLADNTKNQIEWRKAIVNLPLENAAKKTEKLSNALTILEKKLANATSSASKSDIIRQEINKEVSIDKQNQNALAEIISEQQANGKNALRDIKSNISKSVYSTNKDGTLKSGRKASKEDKQWIVIFNAAKAAMKSGKKISLSGLNEASDAYDFADKYNLAFDVIADAEQTAAEGHQDMISALKDLYGQLADLPIDECTEKTNKLSDAMTILGKHLDVAKSTASKRSILEEQLQNNRDSYADKKEAKSTTAKALKKADARMDSSRDSLLKGLSSGVKKQITSAVKNGEAIDITEFEDQLTEKQLKAILDRNAKLSSAYDAAQTADEAYYDIIASSREIAEQLANLPTDRMNDKLEDIDDAKKLLDAKYNVAEGSKNKNAIVDQQTRQAKNELKAYQARATETQEYIESLWGSKDLKTARKSAANKGVKEGEKLSTNGLKVGSAAYDAVVKYNAALKAQTDAEHDAEVAAVNTTAAIRENAKAKFDNVLADYDPELNLNDVTQTHTKSRMDLRTARGKISQFRTDLYEDYKAEQEEQLEMLRNKLNSAKSSYKQNKNSMSEEDRIAAEAELLNIESQIHDTETAIIDTQDTINNIGLKKLQTNMDKLEVSADKLNDKMSLDDVKGIDATAKDYNKLIQNSEKQVANLQEQNVELQKQQEGLSRTSEKYLELQSKIDENEASVRDAEIAQEEWNNAIADLPFQKIEKQLELLDAIQARYESLDKLKVAQGKDLSEADYLKRMEYQDKEIEQLTEEARKALENYQKAMADPEGVYGGKDSKEWRTEYNNYLTSLHNAKIEAEELKDELRDDVYWRDFERAHDAAQRMKDTIEGISDLISDDMLYNSDGKLTDFGASKIATLVKEYENASDEVQNYNNDIKNLHKLFADGQYTELEYTEKLAELKQGLLDSASSMKTYTDAVVNMYKEMGQAELDSLFELIDARNEALSAKKACIIMRVSI